MKTRKLRFEQSLNVASSIRISAVTRPSVKELNQCILSVEVFFFSFLFLFLLIFFFFFSFLFFPTFSPFHKNK